MSYIGNTIASQGFVPTIDTFSGNNSQVAFTLSRPVTSVAQLVAVVENVPQQPGVAFTVSGNTITFTSAPPTGSNNIYVYYVSLITSVVQPGAGTVIPASMSQGGPSWDTNGNVGLNGQIPGAWGQIFKAIESIGGGAIAFRTDAANVDLLGNALFNGSSFIYQKTGYSAVRYRLGDSGDHTWFTAPSGTAGNAVTFTQALALSHNKTLALKGGTPSAGTGITFPATQSASSDANTLDDYEEGTWTPSFLGSSSNPTVTYNGAQGGTYTKIGRLVVAQCYFRFSSFTGGSGSALIGGLPFASSVNNLNGVLSASEWSASFPSSATYPYISGESNGNGPGTYIALIRSGPGVAGVNIQVSNFTSTDTYLLFTFSYFT